MHALKGNIINIWKRHLVKAVQKLLFSDFPSSTNVTKQRPFEIHEISLDPSVVFAIDAHAIRIQVPHYNNSYLFRLGVK